MSSISYTSLLPQTQRDALSVQTRTRRLGLALIAFGFVLMGISVALFVIQRPYFKTKGTTINDPPINEKLNNIQMPTEEDKRHTSFLFVDWRIELGWNNVRYALEHHLFYAHLLNRTLVIPSEVHMRQCYHDAMCSILGRRIKDDTSDSNTGNHWAMPIEYYINLAHLKSKTKVLTIPEFFELHLRRANAASNAVIASQIRAVLASFDLLSEFSTGSGRLASLLLDQLYYEGEMYKFLHEAPKGHIIVDDTTPLELLFLDNPSGLRNVTLYAFVDLPNMAIDTSYEAVATSMPPQLWETQEGVQMYPYLDMPRKHVQVEYRDWDEDQYQKNNSYIGFSGFVQHWATPPFSDAIYLRLAGDPHRFGWQPMKFSSIKGRNLYSTIVLEWLQYSDKVIRIADMAWNRMMNLTDGHDILAFHLRRGDFSTIGWNGAMGDLKVAGKAVVSATSDLRIRYATEQIAANKTGVLAAKFFVATDDTSPEGLAPLYEAGAVRLMDLLSAPNHNDTSAVEHPMDDDSKMFWDINFPLVAFGDWLGLVEQVICSRSWYFVGTGWSSFTGGILNLRAYAGHNFTESAYIDPWAE